MKSPQGNHKFSEIPNAEIQRSVFDRDHGVITTLDAGDLVPIFVDEALPGDTMTVKMKNFGRLSTPITAVMAHLRLTTFFFFVPYRLLWLKWEKFNGAQEDPGDSTDFLIPTVDAPATVGWIEHSMGDYFGLPTKDEDVTTTALPFRAYNKIWNEWFRDENLQDHKIVSTLDGPDAASAYNVWKRGKRHDYFTSSLPFPQKGDSVSLPLGLTAPVIPDGAGAVPRFQTPGTSSLELQTGPLGSTRDMRLSDTPSEDDEWLQWDDPGLVTDLSTATAATINQLRQAFQIQRLLERDARGGTRYIEVIKSHFGVTSPDARLQRSEYLGGGTQVIHINPVPQTSSTDGTSPQGNVSGFGTTAGEHGFTKSFTEHGVVIGLVCISADLTYQQGLDRWWSRQTRWDFFWPALAHLGEQAVLNQEIYFQDSTNSGVWGYQERFAEYRYKKSMVTGLMRSNATGTLDIWHLAQKFTTLPVLDTVFINENPPVDRIIATPTEPHLKLDMAFSFKHARPMPTYGVPGLIDHF